jgi:hypothetical protein
MLASHISLFLPFQAALKAAKALAPFEHNRVRLRLPTSRPQQEGCSNLFPKTVCKANMLAISHLLQEAIEHHSQFA